MPVQTRAEQLTTDDADGSAAATAKPAKATRSRKVATPTIPVQADPPAETLTAPDPTIPAEQLTVDEPPTSGNTITSDEPRPDAGDGATDGATTEGAPARAIGRATVPSSSRGVERTAGRTVEMKFWSAVRSQPRLAPAALAVAAVARYADVARDEADWLRRTYPDVEPARLAREAVRAASRRSRYATGAALIGGPIGTAASVSALTWAHARLVIDIAAVFGLDPSDPARAIDVLLLLGAYPDAGTAAKAVTELLGDVDAPTGDAHRPPTSIRATVSARLAARLAGRLVPGTTAVLDAFRTAADTERLAHRAIRYYRTI